MIQQPGKSSGSVYWLGLKTSLKGLWLWFDLLDHIWKAQTIVIDKLISICIRVSYKSDLTYIHIYIYIYIYICNVDDETNFGYVYAASSFTLRNQ